MGACEYAMWDGRKRHTVSDVLVERRRAGIRIREILALLAPEAYAGADGGVEMGGMSMPCIMPEMPYCPACQFGHIIYTTREALESDCTWECLCTDERYQAYQKEQNEHGLDQR